MGDLEEDTRLDGGDGRWTATLSPSWEIWGPCGGYLAAVLLRAAGAHSAFPRPVSLSVHFLGVARSEPVEVVTETMQRGRRSESIRLTMTQEARPISQALVWIVADPDGREGIEYDWTEPPEVDGPVGLATMDELRPEEARVFPFWQNLEDRPLNWLGPEAWATARPLAPTIQSWFRFRPQAVYEDPFLEAARVAVLCDLLGWPSAVMALEPGVEEQWRHPTSTCRSPSTSRRTAASSCSWTPVRRSPRAASSVARAGSGPRTGAYWRRRSSRCWPDRSPDPVRPGSGDGTAGARVRGA